MKLIVIKGNLKEGLQVVERAVGENSSLPILKNILIEAEGDKIKFTATNLEIAVTTSISGKVIEPGRITIPAGVFLNLISALQSERLNIEVKGGVLEVKTDNYQASIQGSPADDFPIVPQIKNTSEHLEVKGNILKEAFIQVASSAQYSELRPELSSVLFDYSIDKMKFVATDSFRLSEKTISEGHFKAGEMDNFRILIPIKTIHEIIRITKEDEMVKIFRDPNQILFQTESWSLISRLIDGNFPDYTAILPKAFETEIWLDRSELMNALKLAGVFSSKVSEIKIKVGENKKSVEVFSNDQSGENNYILPAKIQGKPREISFNWKYIMDGLKALETEEVFWGVNEENKPALLRSPNEASYFYIVMPILKA